MGGYEAKLNELGVTLPGKGEAPKAAGNYLPHVIDGDLVFVSGQISQGPEGIVLGRLGETMDVEAGAAAAKLCAIQLLTQVKLACDGDLDRLKQVVKLTGFVNSTPDFTDQPKVINGCSDFLVEVFGDAGRHARSAVGVSALPLGVAVEIEGIFRIA